MHFRDINLSLRKNDGKKRRLGGGGGRSGYLPPPPPPLEDMHIDGVSTTIVFVVFLRFQTASRKYSKMHGTLGPKGLRECTVVYKPQHASRGLFSSIEHPELRLKSPNPLSLSQLVARRLVQVRTGSHVGFAITA